ncbi:MAG: hypothetical protein GQ564_17330 [Bacteroidales bacterium]|nr:hypothetical protein [Bacteroidales bacterium]
MKYKANIYPNDGTNTVITNSDSNKANLGICFSGGGSRALTCAWGQILGLKTLSLMDKIRYISSVSGGTWASSIYSFLPDSISDEELLGIYYTPEKLSLKDGTGNLNVNTLGKYNLGVVPVGLKLTDLIESAGIFLVTHPSSEHKWLWADLISKLVLDPFGLRSKGDEPWSSSKSFSLSKEYIGKHFPQESPSIDDFYFLRAGRPFIIMNNNIMEKVQTTDNGQQNIVQLPNQVTAVAGGVKGQTPDASIVGGGLVETYGVCSSLEQDSAKISPLNINVNQPYSLIDIVSTSSAFFAETIASLIKEELTNPDKKKDLIKQIEAKLTTKHKESLLKQAEKDLSSISEIILHRLEEHLLDEKSFIGNIVPTYNYWPLGANSKNKETEYTDGGTLDNTGVVGMLSQTDTGKTGQDPLNLVVFDNTSTALEKKNGKIIAGGQAAPLFGIDFSDSDGVYQAFTVNQKDPSNKEFKATSLIAVFENKKYKNDNAPFDKLVKGLYATNCGSSEGKVPDDNKVGTDPAFHQMQLTTINNPLANITGGRKVNILYIQNARILNWQNKIGDEDLKNEILEGQKASGIIHSFKDFEGFPCYSTFTKIGLEPKESNALSQMWAWATSDDNSPLKKPLQDFIKASRRYKKKNFSTLKKAIKNIFWKHLK